jgi:hypothetical protein
MQAVLLALGEALRCIPLLLLVPGGALLACWLAVSVARRDRGVFEFTDGLIFGALGGAAGGVAMAVGCALIARGDATTLRDGAASSAAGLAVGAIVGAAFAVAVIWRQEARRRRDREHPDRAA